MNAKLRNWMPIALCCLPGVAIAVIIGVAISVGGSAIGASLGGPLGIGLVVLAALACPLSMYLMMTRQRGWSQQSAPSGSQVMTDCCAPGEQASSDLYDVPISLAKQLFEYQRTIQLTFEQQIIYDEAAKLSEEGGPCCCRCC